MFNVYFNMNIENVEEKIFKRQQLPEKSRNYHMFIFPQSFGWLNARGCFTYTCIYPISVDINEHWDNEISTYQTHVCTMYYFSVAMLPYLIDRAR